MSRTLSKASQLRIKEIRQEYERERDEMKSVIDRKDHEINAFHKELEHLMQEMETLGKH
jgi:prefoldin subunit 5